MVWLGTVCAGCGYAASRSTIGNVWEPVRELFAAEWKTAKNGAAVDDSWKARDRGELSLDQARDKIFDLAGGIGTPEWATRGVETRSPWKGSTYR
jgi:hypothetical protein